MPKVYNKRDKNIPASAVYVGRPTKFGNPFFIGKDGTREEVLVKYDEWLMENDEVFDAIDKELRGKDLVCWCAPLPCHADMLLEIANQEYTNVTI